MFQKVPIPNSCSYVVKDKVSSSHIYHSLSSLTHILRYMYMFSFSSSSGEILSSSITHTLFRLSILLVRFCVNEMFGQGEVNSLMGSSID